MISCRAVFVCWLFCKDYYVFFIQCTVSVFFSNWFSTNVNLCAWFTLLRCMYLICISYTLITLLVAMLLSTVGERSIEMSVSVCLSVFLLAYLEDHTSKFHLAHSSSDGKVIYYVLPVLWITPFFNIMARIGKNTVLLTSPGAVPGDSSPQAYISSGVCVCILHTLLIFKNFFS